MPVTKREGDWLIGVGCATGTYPYYRMPGGAERLTIPREGRATVAIAAHEMGMGAATAQAQVAAERLGLPLEQVQVLCGDTLFPGAVLAGGSQPAIGASIIAAHRALVKELPKFAGNDSSLACPGANEVGGLDGGLCALEDGSHRESYASILSRARREEVTVEAEAPMPLELQHWSMHSHSALFCEVRVNVVTGEPRVSRFLGSFDCGRILNAKTAVSQFRRGIIIGLGLALMEEVSFDERSGRIMNPSLAEYPVPVHLDVPDIDVIWTDEPDPHAPLGARGVGEIGITCVGATVANAVFNATGKRVRDRPNTLDRLMQGGPRAEAGACRIALRELRRQAVPRSLLGRRVAARGVTFGVRALDFGETVEGPGGDAGAIVVQRPVSFGRPGSIRRSRSVSRVPRSRNDGRIFEQPRWVSIWRRKRGADRQRGDKRED